MGRMRSRVRVVWLGVAALGVAILVACAAFDGAPAVGNDAGPEGGGFVEAGSDVAMPLKCAPGYADCNGDGKTCETHLLGNDPGNCGTCGRTCSACGAGCESATCTAGRCDAHLIASQQSSPGGIAVDDAGIYWVTSGPDGGIVGAAHDGTPTIAIADPNARRVAVDDEAIYWTSDRTGVKRAARTCDASDCIETVVLMGHELGIAVDGTRVYATGGQNNTNGGYVATLRKDTFDAGAVILADNQGDPAEIAVDDASVYWTMGAGYQESLMPNARGAQRRAKTPTCTFAQDCNAQRLLRAPVALGIAVDDKNLYLANNDADAGAILRLSKLPTDAGTFETIASGQRSPTALAADDRYVYWVNSVPTGRAGSVMRIARDGSCPAGLPCPEVLVAPGGAAADIPSSIVVHGKSVYFTTAGFGTNNGAIWKIAK